MSKTTTHGPNATAVSGVTTLSFAPAPINFATDMRVIDEGPGRVLYTDVTAPTDQKSTLRLAQTSKNNIYAGTSVDPAAFLSSREGSSTIIEIRELWKETDSADASYAGYGPVRAALTLDLPVHSMVTSLEVRKLIARVIAAVAAQGLGDLDAGVTALLHGVVQKY